jgi:succinate dehydrogenase / fumarate reductase cytochrome b subunit
MTSKKLQRDKPLSPHIQIYKPQISSFTSILHRITGIFLYIGVVIICWTIVYQTYQLDILVDSDMTKEQCSSCSLFKYFLYSVVIAWSLALYYHLCNGIRHLFWDAGKGFDKETANRNGLLVLFAAATLTIASVCYVLFFSQLN